MTTLLVGSSGSINAGKATISFVLFKGPGIPALGYQWSKCASSGELQNPLLMEAHCLSGHMGERTAGVALALYGSISSEGGQGLYRLMIPVTSLKQK